MNEDRSRGMESFSTARIHAEFFLGKRRMGTSLVSNGDLEIIETRNGYYGLVSGCSAITSMSHRFQDG